MPKLPDDSLRPLVNAADWFLTHGHDVAWVRERLRTDPQYGGFPARDVQTAVNRALSNINWLRVAFAQGYVEPLHTMGPARVTQQESVGARVLITGHFPGRPSIEASVVVNATASHSLADIEARVLQLLHAGAIPFNVTSPPLGADITVDVIQLVEGGAAGGMFIW